MRLRHYPLQMPKASPSTLAPCLPLSLAPRHDSGHVCVWVCMKCIKHKVYLHILFLKAVYHTPPPSCHIYRVLSGLMFTHSVSVGFEVLAGNHIISCQRQQWKWTRVPRWRNDFMNGWHRRCVLGDPVLSDWLWKLITFKTDYLNICQSTEFKLSTDT